MAEPELSVVIASHDRPLRLRWLLNALMEQTLGRAHWEVVIAHDSRGPETDAMLAAHPLAREGVLRWQTLPLNAGTAGAHRNAALRLARAPILVFTDDDCRPPEDWLENVLAAVRRNPGAVIQGPVRPDPDEWPMLRSAFPRTQMFWEVPRMAAECCNIVYPRALVEQLGGFIEDMEIGEDTDLNLRAQAAGAPYVGDERMLTYHAVDEGSVVDRWRAAWRWVDLPLLVRRHPQLRKDYTVQLFWRPSHLWLPVAILGLFRARRGFAWAALAAPWVSYPFLAAGHGTDLRGRLRTVMELPALATIDLVEMLALSVGSVRWRSFLI